MSEESLFEFPCDVPIKVFGRNTPGFRHMVLSIVRAHWKDLSDANVSERLSRNDSYLSLTIVVYAHSRTQIDAVYQELTNSKQVLMML
jgi:hypothetical protein